MARKWYKKTFEHDHDLLTSFDKSDGMDPRQQLIAIQKIEKLGQKMAVHNAGPIQTIALEKVCWSEICLRDKFKVPIRLYQIGKKTPISN